MTKTLIKAVKQSIFADYFQIYVMDSECDGLLESVWQMFNPIDKIVSIPGLISIGTVRPFQSNFEIELHSEEPMVAKNTAWDNVDHVTEATTTFPSGKLIVKGCSDTSKGRATISIEVNPDTIYRVRILSSQMNDLSVSGMSGLDTYKVYVWPVDKQLPSAAVLKRYTPNEWKKQTNTRLAYYANPPCGQAMFKQLAFVSHGQSDMVNDEIKSMCENATDKYFKERIATKAPFAILSDAASSETCCEELLSSSGLHIPSSKNKLIGSSSAGEDWSAENVLKEVCDILGNTRIFSDEHPDTLETGIPGVKPDPTDIRGAEEVIIPIFGSSKDTLSMAKFVAESLNLGVAQQEKLSGLKLTQCECILVGTDGVEVLTI
eukprot:CFRG3064T1